MKKNNNQYLQTINRPALPHQKQNLPTISIFSGILGLEIGLERLGFKTRYALDFDKHCKDAVENNRKDFGDFPYLSEDINKITAEDILKVSGLEPGETVILAGGPPCQPFSKSGLRKGIGDERGLLFKRYLDYLKVIKPKTFILENVRGLFSSNGGQDFKNIIEHFEETGYTIYWKILDAANYGVPQFRQRLFIIGFRDRIKFDFPKETHGDPTLISSTLFPDLKPYSTVHDAIGDLEGKVETRILTGKYAHLLSDIPEGSNYSFYTSERGHPNPLFGWRTKFWYFLLKTDRTKPSLTIQAYPGNNTGPFHWENRRMAIEEIRRIQSFPDWLKIQKPYMVAHRLIGNAIPPLLAEAIGKSILEALNRSEKISEEEYRQIRNDHDGKNGIVKSGRGSGKGRSKVASKTKTYEAPAKIA